MKITKEFGIHAVKSSRVSNTPFQIVLDGKQFNKDEKSVLTLDEETVACFGIPMSFDLIKETLVCSIESRELPLKDNRYVDMSLLERDNLVIRSLKEIEETLVFFGTIPPSKHVTVSRTLSLSSFGGGDSIHPPTLPCPFYRIFFELTEEEYEACKALPPTSIFRASFYLK